METTGCVACDIVRLEYHMRNYLCRKCRLQSIDQQISALLSERAELEAEERVVNFIEKEKDASIQPTNPAKD
jgi:hypothetical protein